MGIKSDFKQAVKEVFSPVGGAKEEPAQKTNQKPNNSAGTPAASAPKQPKEQPVVVQHPGSAAIRQPEIKIEPIQKAPAAPESTEITVISKDTVINGNIVANSSMRVNGVVNGDIACSRQLEIYGEVTGNLKSKSMYIDTGKINGNLSCSENLAVSEATLVIGDIDAGSAKISGKVKGNVTAKDLAIFDKTSVVVGDIKSNSLQINDGAVIQGTITMARDEKAIQNLFNENRNGNKQA